MRDAVINCSLFLGSRAKYNKTAFEFPAEALSVHICLRDRSPGVKVSIIRRVIKCIVTCLWRGRKQSQPLQTKLFIARTCAQKKERCSKCNNIRAHSHRSSNNLIIDRLLCLLYTIEWTFPRYHRCSRKLPDKLDHWRPARHLNRTVSNNRLESTEKKNMTIAFLFESS